MQLLLRLRCDVEFEVALCYAQSVGYKFINQILTDTLSWTCFDSYFFMMLFASRRSLANSGAFQEQVSFISCDTLIACR